MSDDFDLDYYERSALERRAGVKWSRDREGAIAAWIADMDFPIAPAIKTALINAIGSDDLGYPANQAEDAVRQAFAQRQWERYRFHVDPAHVLVLADVLQGIYLSILALTEPGDGVAFLTPSYPPFFGAITETGRRVVTCDLADTPDGYRIDFVALQHRIEDEGVRVLLLCNPHNPTGRVFTNDEIDGLVALCKSNDLYVISDEIHADLVLGGAAHVPIATRDDEIARRTVTLSSASKTFNIAGLRCAVAACGSPELGERLARTPRRLLGGVSVAGTLAAVTAWNECGPWLDAVIAKLEDNRSLLMDRVSRLGGVHVHAPEATYLAWLDLRNAGLGDNPAQILREKARIALLPGQDFGTAGIGYVRVNFATPRPVLLELLDRFEEVLI